MAEPGAESGLGRQVERLSRQVVKTDAQVRSLAAGLQRLTERVTSNTSPGSPGSGSADPSEADEVLTSWLTTSDFPEATALVDALTPWITAVYLRFPDSDLPTCWALHPHVVEELWWLRNAWFDAYAGPKPSWQKIGDWHDRQRPGVVKRLSGGDSGNRCNLGKHATNPQPEPAAPMPDLLPHVLTAWCSTGRARWPLSPTTEQIADARRHEDAAAERR